MKYKVIVSDIDGTLINDNHELTKENRLAIQEFIECGGHFVLASGRPDIGMLQIVEECGLDKQPGYLIAFNGGKIMRTDTKEVLFSEGISQEALAYFTDFADENDMSICSYDKENIFATSASIGVQVESKLTTMDYQLTDDLASQFDNKFIPKAIIFGDEEEIAQSLEELTNRPHNQEVELAISHPTFLEISGLGINKGKALYQLAKLLNVEVSEIIAVGDGGNDLAMIKEAGLGVAVANATNILKAAADVQTVSNNEHVIAELLKKYF